MAQKQKLMENDALAEIVGAMLATLMDETNFTRRTMSEDVTGKAVSVWSNEAARRDVYGWALKHTYDRAKGELHNEAKPDKKTTESAFRVTEELDRRIKSLWGGCSLVSLGNDSDYVTAARLFGRIYFDLRGELWKSTLECEGAGP